MEYDVRIRAATGPAPTLVSSDMEGEVFRPPRGGVVFRDVQFREVSFTGARFDYFRADGSRFIRCDFQRARFDVEAVPHISFLKQSVFTECRFDRARLPDANLGQARFERCTFDHAVVRGWLSFAAEFVDCHFAGRIDDCKFFGGPWGPTVERLDPQRTQNELRGNDFRDADLVDTVFANGVDIGAQLWPEDEKYVRLDQMSKRIARVRAEVVQWTDLEARRRALQQLEELTQLYGAVPSQGIVWQEEVFARRVQPDEPWPEVAEQIWAMLSRVHLAGA